MNLYLIQIEGGLPLKLTAMGNGTSAAVEVEHPEEATLFGSLPHAAWVMSNLVGWARARGVKIHASRVRVLAPEQAASQPPPLPAEASGPPVLPTLRALLAEISLDAEREDRCAVAALARRFAVAVTTRAEEGEVKYGTPLHAHNGRDAARDEWEEALDLAQYAVQRFLEGDVDGGRTRAKLGLLVALWGLMENEEAGSLDSSGYSGQREVSDV